MINDLSIHQRYYRYLDNEVFKSIPVVLFPGKTTAL